jgi:hypothetical protein
MSSAGSPHESLLVAMQASPVRVIVHPDRTTVFREGEMIEQTLILEEEIVENSKDEEILIQSWRAEQLERLGLSRILAQLFAGIVDWHEIAALVARGCPPLLAVEIVR